SHTLSVSSGCAIVYARNVWKNLSGPSSYMTITKQIEILRSSVMKTATEGRNISSTSRIRAYRMIRVKTALCMQIHVRMRIFLLISVLDSTFGSGFS
ncbi:hypothetical protein PMAYCL1PPCAC_22903, partial [Pristionchus mayeri]